MSADRSLASHDVDRIRRPVDVIDIEFWSRPEEVCGVVRWEIDQPSGATRVLVIVAGHAIGITAVCAVDLPIPRNALAVRGPGIWCELICETPLEQWTVGLEAFGVRLGPEDPISPDSRGYLTPLGLDLDLETRLIDGRGEVGIDDDLLTAGVRVAGELLVADLRFEIDGEGRRRRGGQQLANEGQAADLPTQFQIAELRQRVVW